MKLFKRVDRTLAKHDAIEADIKRRDGVQEPASFASRCRHVRTRSGRTAHLEHPESGAVLCQWPGAETEADPSLPVCRLCEVAALIADEGKAS